MKVVVNLELGKFKLVDTASVDLLLQSGADLTGLAILDIPNNATDWMILYCDGAARVIYVLDGKLYKLDYEEEDEHESD